MVNEKLELRILDNFGLKIYTARVPIADKKAIAQALFFLTKYGIDIEELVELIKKEKESYYDYSKI